MGMENTIKELDQICEFLNGHSHIEKASYTLTNEQFTVTVQSDTALDGLNIWASHISTHLEQIFKKPVKFEICGPEGENSSVESTTDVTSVQKKLIGKTTYVFSSFDSKYRLLRIEPDKKSFDSSDMYYESNTELSETELKNVNQIFQLAADDHRNGKFVHNIIELNVNNIKTPEVYKKFAFAFRQIPKQLTERFVISLVRIPIQQETVAINKAIGAFRKLISPVYISFELDAYLHNVTKIRDLDCDGFVITAGNPKRKDIAGILRKSHLQDIDKTVLVLYYTRDWKDIPSIHSNLIPLYMKSKLSN